MDRQRVGAFKIASSLQVGGKGVVDGPLGHPVAMNAQVIYLYNIEVILQDIKQSLEYEKNKVREYVSTLPR
jgi:hypothetical protein